MSKFRLSLMIFLAGLFLLGIWGLLKPTPTSAHSIVTGPATMGLSSCAAVTPYAANGNITDTVETFRAAVGDPNAPTPFNNLDGRRQINWDAAPAAVSDPNPFPGDFFNFNATPRARGIEFTTTGTGFLLSGDVDDGTPIEFESIDPSYKDEFTTFSAERLFTPIGSNIVEVRFFNPADQITPATVDGFGAVFTDVDLAGITKLDFYDQADNLIYTITAEPNWGTTSETLTFLGAKFESNCIFRVKITAGNIAPANGIVDGVDGYDVVVMDDFIYGEPTALNQACGLPSKITQESDIVVEFGSNAVIDEFRSDLGTLNPFEPTNFPNGRRQINWDAAPAAVSDPNAFPGDFFNFSASPRARGIEFKTDGDGLLLSGDVDDGTPIRFSSINSTYATEFGAFSQERLFSPIGSNQVTAHFFSPADQTTPALVTGFGAVFTDVDLGNVTHIRYLDVDGNLVWSQAVPATAIVSEVNLSGTLQFLGVQFETACVGSVEIVAGNTPLGPNDDPGNGIDVVALDDFIFGEPQPVNGTGFKLYLPFVIR